MSFQIMEPNLGIRYQSFLINVRFGSVLKTVIKVLKSGFSFSQTHLQHQLQLHLKDDIALFLFYPPTTYPSRQVVTLTQTELG